MATLKKTGKFLTPKKCLDTLEVQKCFNSKNKLPEVFGVNHQRQQPDVCKSAKIMWSKEFISC